LEPGAEPCKIPFSILSYSGDAEALIINRRPGQKVVTENLSFPPFTLENESVRTTPGSEDVLSARVEGDPYLAADGLSDESQPAA
jgi:hypothetical protein